MDFFDQQTRSSKIKALIVSEYFPQYARIILRKGQTKIRYVDLFAGPGIYNDGSLSTPILIADAVSADPVLKDVVSLLFNDNHYIKELEENFEERYPPKTFRYKPKFSGFTVGEHEGITRYLTTQHQKPGVNNPHPTLLFIDPFGYKGVDTVALASFMRDWGNEVFLFVNIKRIHAAIKNDKFGELMQELFPTTFEQLESDRRYTSSVNDRLQLILQNIVVEFRKVLGKRLLWTAFKFKEEDSAATSHYILHFTKHPSGFDLIKQIYDEFDNIGAVLLGNNTYAFDAKKLDDEIITGTGFDFGDENVTALSEILYNAYQGKAIRADYLFQEHHVTGQFSRRHYRESLRKIVEQGKLVATFTDGKNHKVSVLINPFCHLQFK